MRSASLYQGTLVVYHTAELVKPCSDFFVVALLRLQHRARLVVRDCAGRTGTPQSGRQPAVEAAAWGAGRPLVFVDRCDPAPPQTVVGRFVVEARGPRLRMVGCGNFHIHIASHPAVAPTRASATPT